MLRMRAPLLELRDKIQGFRGAVEGSLLALKDGLSQRAEATAAREVLELLLDTFHVVSKVILPCSIVVDSFPIPCSLELMYK